MDPFVAAALVGVLTLIVVYVLLPEKPKFNAPPKPWAQARLLLTLPCTVMSVPQMSVCGS